MKILFLMVLFFNSLSAVIHFSNDLTIPIRLEHAVTFDQIMWGLMQRRELPDNEGMTFNYTEPNYLNMWMFNCWIDMSVAFLNERKVIQEIFSLYAHPERMDPRRPVRNVRELQKYSFNEPNVKLFIQEAVNSSFPCKFALEMNKKWFHDHNVKAGDVVYWNINSTHGYVIRTIDVGPYLTAIGLTSCSDILGCDRRTLKPCSSSIATAMNSSQDLRFLGLAPKYLVHEIKPIAYTQENLRLQFPDSAYRSLYFPDTSIPYEVIFENNGVEVGRERPSPQNNPVICLKEVSSILIGR